MAIQAADKERGIEIRLAKEFKPKNVEKTTAKPATLFIGTILVITFKYLFILRNSQNFNHIWSSTYSFIGGEAFASGDVRARIIEEIFGEFGEIDRIRYGTNRFVAPFLS